MSRVIFTASSVAALEERDAGQELARLHNVRIDRTRQDASRLYRREAITIKNPETGEWVLRIALGAGRLIEGLTHDGIALDYDAMEALGVRRGASCALEVSRAREIDVLRWYWHHADPGLRLSIRLGGMGVLLGTLGMFLGMS